MKKSTLGQWSILIAILWFILTGCSSDTCNCGDTGGDGDTDADADADGDADSDADSDTDGGPALGSFCNPLALGDADTVISLIIGDGAQAVTLSASTQTCSNRLGDACATIPVGPSVPLVLQDATGAQLSATQMEITDGADYLFYTTVVEGQIALETGTIGAATADCANMECMFKSYNDRTCVADDPCGWAGDGICNEPACLNALPDGTDMFDDTADCP